MLNYIYVFLEGILSFISPCILPMLPILLGYFTKQGNQEMKVLIKKLLLFILGFTIVFVILGVLVNVLTMVFGAYQIYLKIFFAIFIILLGINYTGIIKIGILNKDFRASKKQKENLSYLESLVFGLGFGAVYSPCTGAYLASALGKASEAKTLIEGIVLLIMFSLGIGIPMLLSGIFISKLQKLFKIIKQNYNIINILSGLLLILSGVYSLIQAIITIY
mgnify:CR=1 FL=1